MGLPTSERAKEKRRVLLKLQRAHRDLIDCGLVLFRYDETGSVKLLARGATDAAKIHAQVVSGVTRLG